MTVGGAFGFDVSFESFNSSSCDERPVLIGEEELWGL
jgi:hypothetical protein